MELFDLLKKMVDVFEKLGIRYLVTGSVASMAYGEPRLTNDIDIVAEIETHQISALFSAFPTGEYYISENMIKEAIERKGQFNIIHPGSGLKVDVIIRQNTAFDNSRFGRLQHIRPTDSYQANFAAPEDVIIKKMEYYREGGSEKHLRDIAGIMKISSELVDRDYIARWAQRLGLTEIWDALMNRVDKKNVILPP
jgi:hypothetical protein